jgi:hypothetical protein
VTVDAQRFWAVAAFQRLSASTNDVASMSIHTLAPVGWVCQA